MKKYVPLFLLLILHLDGSWNLGLFLFFPVLAMYQMRVRDMYVCNWLLREQFGKFSEMQCFHIWCLMKVK